MTITTVTQANRLSAGSLKGRRRDCVFADNARHVARVLEVFAGLYGAFHTLPLVSPTLLLYLVRGTKSRLHGVMHRYA